MEFTKGYWEEKPLKVGGGVAITRTYHPDQRAVFCNAVDFLLWIVTPMGDKEFIDKYTTWEGKADKWEEKIKERMKVFKDINIMFARCKFFDNMSGVTE